MISPTLYNDPACPWAYSERPALRVLEWRYGEQLEWGLVLIGLTEDRSQYEARGYTPVRGALGQLSFRRYGMPFSPAPKPRLSATARACRAVVAARLLSPGSEWVVFRALQLANFTSPIVLEDDEHLRTVPGARSRDRRRRHRRRGSTPPRSTEAYERDRAAARSAAGTAAELQGKTATTDGPVRFTAPVGRGRRRRPRARRRRLSAGRGLRRPVANLDPTLERRPAPDTPAAAEALPRGADHPGGRGAARRAATTPRTGDAAERR